MKKAFIKLTDIYNYMNSEGVKDIESRMGDLPHSDNLDRDYERLFGQINSIPFLKERDELRSRLESKYLMVKDQRNKTVVYPSWTEVR